jgi:hypothetical protein
MRDSEIGFWNLCGRALDLFTHLKASRVEAMGSLTSLQSMMKPD